MFSGKIEDYILFEDKEIIVCRKPAGIAVQNARIGAMDLESSLKNYLAMRAGDGRKMPYLAVIHRLDQPVEGVLVFGKTPKAAKALSAQITAGKMEKIYLAVTYGQPDIRACEMENGNNEDGSKSVVLEDYLKKDGRTNTSAVVNAGTPGAKKARLSYEVLGEAKDKISGKKKWLLRIHLDTGRHHQIRVQMAHAGMPLAGDRKYGAGGNVTIGAGNLALCAASLTFSHPLTGKKMKFETKPEGTEFAEFQM
ncbi:RluA family pseudouridine synthase [Blautia sp. Sow4_E7]|uniref:RluA family pseudouridine synthase n=1 Tax=Blautia sp. Sow4_E7 TaxID=3438749 RepID=UPI003F91320F